MKEGLRKLSGGCLETNLFRFLFQYRLTPHTTTDQSSAHLLLGQRPRSHLDLLHPDLTSRVEHKQKLQKQRYDQHTTVHQFVPDDTVYVRNFGEGDTWLAGTIVNTPGPRSYIVKLSDDRVVRRYADHICFCYLPDHISDTSSDGTIPFPTISDVTSPADNVVPSVPLRCSTRTSNLLTD